jgi:hypothetical protein
MQYIGTRVSLTLGAWRLRFVLALEDAPEEVADGDESTRRVAPRDRQVPHIVRIDPHASWQQRN